MRFRRRYRLRWFLVTFPRPRLALNALRHRNHLRGAALSLGLTEMDADDAFVYELAVVSPAGEGGVERAADRTMGKLYEQAAPGEEPADA